MDIQSEFLAFLKSRGTVNVLSPQTQSSFGLNQVSVPAASIVELPSKQSNLKPGSYDGSSAWSLYERQFNMISKVNGWSPSQKAANLTASLSGPALVVLGSLSDSDSENFDSICAALKLRFGEEHLSKLYFTQFENRRQGPKEDLASLGNDIERLARHSLTDCAEKARDQIARAKFINAIRNPELRYHLRLAAPTSLHEAIIKGLELEAINEADLGSRQLHRLSQAEPSENSSSRPSVNQPSSDSLPGRKNSGFSRYNRSNSNRPVLECQFCGVRGHIAKNCFKLDRQLKTAEDSWRNNASKRAPSNPVWAAQPSVPQNSGN